MAAEGYKAWVRRGKRGDRGGGALGGGADMRSAERCRQAGEEDR